MRTTSNKIIVIAKNLAIIVAAPVLMLIALIAFVIVGTALGIAAGIACFAIYLAVLAVAARITVWFACWLRGKPANRREKIMAVLYFWTFGIIALPSGLKELAKAIWQDRKTIWAEMTTKQPEASMIES